MSFVAVAVGGGAALSAGVSASGGKKGRGIQKQQLALQQQQLAFGKGLVDTGMTAWTPAKDYWTALLHGGQSATEAVGPYAAQIRMQGTGADRAIRATLPMGGERNLARAQNFQQNYGQIARLTAGVQPTAANALAQLSQIPISAGTGTSANALNASTNTSNSIAQSQQAGKAATQQGASGIGNLLYNAINKPKTPGGTASTTGAGGDPGWWGTGAGGGIGTNSWNVPVPV